MCGITGIVATTGQHDLRSVVTRMTDPLIHRGPDGWGVWTDEGAGVGFGHRRLAIVDLSEAGHQPMRSSCGRFVITYNGEVYNAQDLRDELAANGRQFRGHSDTEVIVEAISMWGVRASLNRLIGMFAFGVWDVERKELTLVRDRIGIKPLYWSFDNGVFLFSSELKSLAAFSGFSREIDREAVISFLRHNYIPAPKTIYQAAQKLMPGSLLRFKAGEEPKLETYWQLKDAVEAGRNTQNDFTDEEAVGALDELLSDAVQRRMVSDVPLGAFLSGGIDSSVVAALMQKSSNRPVKTFSIGFNVAGYNEAHHASLVAQHLGTDHTELYVEPGEARNVIPELAQIYDEPFADSSQIPTYLLSALTRRHVTVALSGDGGDELFFGYNRYLQSQNLMQLVWKVPMPVRTLAANGLMSVPVGVWDRLLYHMPVLSRYSTPGDKIHKLASVLSQDQEGYYRRLVSHWEDPCRLVAGAEEVVHQVWSEAKETVPDFESRMQYLDTLTYLPDDILTKVDRASMAASLEARVPILDHRVVEFSWQLNDRFKMRDGKGKWILRQVLDRYVPRQLVDRPKMGFGVPIDHWLRHDLKEWASELLSPSSLKKHGLITPDLVEKRWAEHLDGRRNWQYLLWDILMLQAWCEEWA